MSESSDEFLRHVAAEMRADAENLPALTLTERLCVPLPAGDYAPIEDAPEWVARRTDGCAGRRCMAYAAPTLWAVNGNELVCAYRCGRCRTAWWTSWGISPEEVAA